MGIWDDIKGTWNGIAQSSWNPGNWGNPMNWGKTPTNPNNSRLDQGDYLKNYIRQQLGGINGRQAPQAGNTQIGNVFTGQASQLDNGPQNQFRNGQNALVGELQGVANGTQMGAGEMAIQRQMRQAAAQQQSLAAGARGANAALATRAAARGLGNLQVDAAGQAAQARMGDQAQARNVLAGVLGQGREQDIGMAQANAQLKQQMNLANLDAQNQKVFQQAGLDQATSLANMQARLQMLGMNDQATLGYLGQLFGVSAAEMQARLAQEQGYAQQQSAFGSILQGASAAGMAAMMSDERAKRDVMNGRSAVRSFMGALNPVTYSYKDPRNGAGTFAGVLAQDAERSAVGREMVRDTPAGKMLDDTKVKSALLASIADLHARLAKLEGKG